MPLRRLAAALFAVLLCAQAVPALTIIDNFQEGPTTVSDDGSTSGPTTEELGGFSSANTVGGTRFVSVEARSTVAELPATLPASAAIGTAGALLTAGEVAIFIFQWDGVLSGVGDGSAGALNLDLTSHTTIDVTSTVLAPGAFGSVRIWDSVGTQIVASAPLVTGTTSYDLADFTAIDLSDIQAIQLRVSGVGTDSPEVLLQSIVAVPEPGTALLLGLGLGALALQRRRTA